MNELKDDMENLAAQLKAELLAFGADIVGFGDITELPPKARAGLPTGVSVAVNMPAEIARGIAELPTSEYFDFYNRANEALDGIVTRGAEFLKSKGYVAIAQTRDSVGSGGTENRTALPHKTVATRAGIGWIGKCALLVTKERGSMLRLSSILTDAPLTPAQSVDSSRCGSCNACAVACPGHAVLGELWAKGKPREEFFDAAACRVAARKRAILGFGVNTTICGKCIEACPYTRKAIEKELGEPTAKYR
ncbi:MAG: epoxyqueuosine reductase [Clostridiales bacterium]|jgi:epoxyqueuosine reductase QueG|nr:epoxyqueuosine reductase [Clostridiales bacterium]